MNKQEQQKLQGVVDRVKRMGLADRDTDAEQFLERTLGRNPDALYAMARTVLMLDQALDEAQRQIENLRRQGDPPRVAAQSPKHWNADLQPSLSDQDEHASVGSGPGLMYPSGGYPIAGAPQQDAESLQPSMHGAGAVRGFGSFVDSPGSDRLRDTSYGAGVGCQVDDGTNAEDLSGTEGTDYSSQGDDSMLADDVGSEGRVDSGSEPVGRDSSKL